MTAKVEIYTWSTCPFCLRAKALLDRKGVTYTEYAIDGDNVARDNMSRRAQGRRTLPQVFINDQLIGGASELYDLDAQGKLDQLFTQTS